MRAVIKVTNEIYAVIKQIGRLLCVMHVIVRARMCAGLGRGQHECYYTVSLRHAVRLIK